MVMKIEVAVILVLVAGVVSAAPLSVEDLSGKRSFRTVNFSKFLDKRINGTYPLKVKIPRIYKSWEIGYDVTQNLWATEEDYELLNSGKAHSGNYGFFISKLTLRVGYDYSSDQFFSGSDRGAASMAVVMEELGFSDITVERIDHLAVPMLQVDARSEDGVTSNVIYVATRIDTNVIFIYYRRADDWSEADKLIWNIFRDSLIGRNER